MQGHSNAWGGWSSDQHGRVRDRGQAPANINDPMQKLPRRGFLE